MLRRTGTALLFSATLVFVGLACTTDPTTSAWRAGQSPLRDASAGGHSLLVCGVGKAQSVTAEIGPVGGVLSAGRTRVVIPSGAVVTPTTFTLKVPASPYVEVEVTAGGAQHFVFDAPVTVSLDYGRCSRPDLGQTPLTAWNIDPESKALLEAMGGADDKNSRVITFSTVHFSGYAVAD